MELTYKEKIYNVEIIKKNNKNIYIRVKDGKVVITCNYLTTKREIDRLIKENYNVITKMIDKEEKRKEKEEKFYLFGNVYDVIYGFKELSIEKNKIYVLDQKQLEKYLDKKIKEIFSERLTYFYNKYEEKIPIPNLKIRKMTSRWGVCNLRNKNITLNYQLYKYDMICLDYVIIHELSHFLYPDHSKEFWKQVAKYCPNYKAIRKQLNE